MTISKMKLFNANILIAVNNYLSLDMDASDISFQCVDEEEETFDDSNANLNADYQPRSVRVNEQKKKHRGKDLDWVPKTTFLNAGEYHNSDLFADLKKNFTLRRKHELEYGESHQYTCKFARKTHYLSCPHEVKVIFPCDTLEILVQTFESHYHVPKEEQQRSSTLGYRWSETENDVIVQGIKSGASPTVILRNLRDKGCYLTSEEPKRQQLYNKINHLKKVMNLTESLGTTHELRQKIREFEDVPENEFQSYVCYSRIHDDVQNEDDMRICVIFSTKKTLTYLSSCENLHVDSTYRLNYNNWPVMILGVTNTTGSFYASMTILTNYEDAEAWSEVLTFVHGLGIHPKYFMADGATAITKARNEVFGNCEECVAKRLMCWSHVHRNVSKKLKKVETVNKEAAKSFIKDLEQLQWTATDETFIDMQNLLKQKYLTDRKYDSQTIEAFETFFDYFWDYWVLSGESRWYEGACPFRCSNNQGIEGRYI